MSFGSECDGGYMDMSKDEPILYMPMQEQKDTIKYADIQASPYESPYQQDVYQEQGTDPSHHHHSEYFSVFNTDPDQKQTTVPENRRSFVSLGVRHPVHVPFVCKTSVFVLFRFMSSGLSHWLLLLLLLCV